MGNSKVILTEVFRMRDLMGINENYKKNKIIKEAVVGGGGIVDDLIEFLIKKEADELLTLGFKNADEVLTLAKSFPDATIDVQTNILSKILKNASEPALKSLSKNIIDDSSTVIGNKLTELVNQYGDLAKKYPDLRPEYFETELGKQLDGFFKGADESVDNLIKNIKDQALQKVKTATTPVETVVKGFDDKAAKIANDLQRSKDIASLWENIKKSEDFKQLNPTKQTQIQDYLKTHTGKTIKEVEEGVSLEMQKVLKNQIDEGMDSTWAARQWQWFKGLSTMKKILVFLAIGYGLDKLLGVPFIQLFGSSTSGVMPNEEDIEKFKKGWNKSKGTESETTQVPGCPGKSAFDAALQAAYETAFNPNNSTFNDATCEGSYKEGGSVTTYVWKDNDWKPKK
jgi:hypothetical protein